MVLPHGLLDFAGGGKQSGVKHKGQGRGAWVLGQRFEDDNGQVVLALLEEGVGQADLEVSVLGSQGEGLAKLGLGELGPALREQALREMPPQRNILGREANSLPQRFKSAISGQRQLLGQQTIDARADWRT